MSEHHKWHQQARTDRAGRGSTHLWPSRANHIQELFPATAAPELYVSHHYGLYLLLFRVNWGWLHRVKEKTFSLGLQEEQLVRKLRAAPTTAAQRGRCPGGSPQGEARFPWGRASSLRHGPTLVLLMAAEPLEPIFTPSNLPFPSHALWKVRKISGGRKG